MAKWHSSKEWINARAKAKQILEPVCVVCNKELLGDDFTIDHIIPPSQSEEGLPNHDLSNLQAMCRSCNGRKQDRTQDRITRRAKNWFF